MQSLGKIVQRAPAVGAKMCQMWCLFFLFVFFYRQDAAKRQTAGIVFTHRPKIRFFAPQGRLVAPIRVKLCRTDGHLGPLGCAKCDVYRCRGVGMRPPKCEKFPLFGKQSPRRGDSLDRFRQFLVAFIRLTIQRQCFKFHVIHVTGYRVIAEKPRVGKLGHFFLCILQETLYVESKMDDTHSDGHDDLYQRAKFGEDRTTRAGYRCENVVFVFLFVCWTRSESVTYLLNVRSSSAQFEQALRCHLLPDFDAVCNVF